MIVRIVISLALGLFWGIIAWVIITVVGIEQNVAMISLTTGIISFVISYLGLSVCACTEPE